MPPRKNKKNGGSGGSRLRRLFTRFGIGSKKSATSASEGTNQSGFERRVCVGVRPRHTTSHSDEAPPVNLERLYVPNWVRTTKYTAASFVPKNLYEQFRRVANIYFLFIVVLQVIPQVAQGNPFMSAFALCFILFITMVKDGYEDMKRHASDKELNSSQTERIGGNKWTNVNIGLVKEVGFFAKLFGNKSSNNGNDGDNNVAAAAARSSISYGAAHPIGSNVTNSGQVIGGSRALSKVHRQMSVETDEIHLTSLDHSSRQQQQHPRDMLRRMTFSNDESVNIGSSPQWMPVTWADVQVGDLLFLRSHDPIPADVAILATSEQDGTCFVETKQLDGETNLKPREALSNTRHLTSPDALREARFYLDSEAPNPSLYTYKGRLTVLNSDGSSTVEPVSINNMILRGCVLRNTEWIVALVVFTGIDTKIMLNAGETPSKRSRLERIMNVQVGLNFLILFILCILCAILSGVYAAKTNASYYIYGTIYNEKQYNVAFTIFLTFWTSLIVFQNIVPISLYVSIEIVKSIQAFFIHQDINMYYAPLDRRCIPRSWGLSDDLGQVEYIFSDKTGTLTQNIMEFRQCSIRGSVYGEVFFEAEQLEAEAESRKLSSINNNGSEKRVFEDAKREMISEMNLTFNNSYFLEDDCTFVDGKLYRDLRSEGSSKSRAIVEFFTILAVCHTVMAEYPNPDNSNIVTYQAQSPDEAALVSTARNVGFVFKGREGDVLNVEFLGQRQSFTLLHVLEFTSARKRMSVVVSKPDGQRVLFSKGADSIMYPRLRHGQDSLVNTTATHLEEFASSGLRTLVVGYRLVSDDEYSSWSVEFQNACSSLDDRDSLVDAAAEKIEHSLTLVGGTAIEDSLQEGVPESIAQLAMAGIKIWVLTGDKVETAINIGFSCRLLRDDMRLIIVAGKEPEHIRSQLKDALECFIQRSRDPSTANVRTAIGHQGLDDHPQQSSTQSAQSPQSSVKSPQQASNGKPRVSFAPDRYYGDDDDGASEDNDMPNALVIDGETLKYALDSELKALLLEVAKSCASVLCCRVSPLQKAQVVALVKDNLGALCLAIGDGANDVSMIQEADIGVGISGEEGLQAVMASDYAIARFRFLQRLLLVHGRWSYIRIANMILIFFYKNIVWTCAMFWFQIYTGFSLPLLYDYAFIMLYNLAFTAFPIIVLGVFDQDVSADVSMAVPQLFLRGLKNKDFTWWHFWLHVADALYQSAVCFFVPMFAYISTSSHWSGRDDLSLDEVGTVIASCIVIVVNTYVSVNSKNWTWMMPTVVALSIIVFFLFTVVYAQLTISGVYGVETMMFTTPIYYLVVFTTLFACLLPRMLFKYAKQTFLPNDNDLVREMVHATRRKTKKLAKAKAKATGTDGRKSEFFDDSASIADAGWFMASSTNSTPSVQPQPQPQQQQQQRTPADDRRLSGVIRPNQYVGPESPYPTETVMSPHDMLVMQSQHRRLSAKKPTHVQQPSGHLDRFAKTHDEDPDVTRYVHRMSVGERNVVSLRHRLSLRHKRDSSRMATENLILEDEDEYRSPQYQQPVTTTTGQMYQSPPVMDHPLEQQQQQQQQQQQGSGRGGLPRLQISGTGAAASNSSVTSSAVAPSIDNALRRSFTVTSNHAKQQQQHDQR